VKILYLHNKNGYSLAEILISIALIGIGLVAVVGIFPFGLAHIRIIGERIFVIQQSQAKLETLKSLPFNTLYDQYVEETSGTYVGSHQIEQYPMVDRDIYNPLTYDDYIFRAYFTDVFHEDPNMRKGEIIHITTEIYWNEVNPYGRTTTQRTFVLDGYKGQGTK